MSDNNLHHGFGGITHYAVTTPFDVYVNVGTADSNTWFGASKALGTVYQQVTLTVGTPLNAGTWGVRVLHDGLVREATLRLNDKHPFEKTYMGPPEQQWPVENLRQVAEQDATPITGAADRDQRWTLSEIAAAAKPVGRNIDWLLNADQPVPTP